MYQQLLNKKIKPFNNEIMKFLTMFIFAIFLIGCNMDCFNKQNTFTNIEGSSIIIDKKIYEPGKNIMLRYRTNQKL